MKNENNVKFIKESELSKYLEEFFNSGKDIDQLNFNGFKAVELPDGNFEIEFSTHHYPVCKISTRRCLKTARTFNRLNGVEKFLRKMGIFEFKVMLYKNPVQKLCESKQELF